MPRRVLASAARAQHRACRRRRRRRRRPPRGGGDEVWLRLGSPPARASAMLQYHRDGGPWRTVRPDDFRWVDGGQSDGIYDAGLWPLGAIEYRVIVPG